jgi:hypothetical protein
MAALRTIARPALPFVATLLVPALVVTAGCVNAARSNQEGGSATEAGAGTGAGRPPAAEVDSGPPRAVTPGVDIDVTALRKLLGCTPADGRGPCKVLDTMAHCTPWNPVAPSGDGRYMGKGWLVQGTNIEERVAILRSHSVPAGATASWQLPVKIAFGEIRPDAGPAFAQSGRAINAYERHDVPPAKNAAVDFLKETTDWHNESRAVRTSGTMVETFSDSPAYLCRGPDQEVVLVEQGFGAEGKSADGLYARVWASSW